MKFGRMVGGSSFADKLHAALKVGWSGQHRFRTHG
jgi:hypothetical protein